MCEGIVGFYPANSSGDDILLFKGDGQAEEDRDSVAATLHGLRQQAEHDDNDMRYMCVSDFIAPQGQGKSYVGMFAVSVGFGVQTMTEAFDKESDDYNSIMTKVCMAVH